MSLYSKFRRLPVKDKKLFFEAVAFIFIAKFMLVVLPFRMCIKTVITKNYTTEYEINELKSVKKAVRLANRLAFWKNVCLVQSFAASWMLRRRKISSTFSIGIRHNNQKKLTAHAWLMVNDIEIVPRNGDYLTIISR